MARISILIIPTILASLSIAASTQNSILGLNFWIWQTQNYLIFTDEQMIQLTKFFHLPLTLNLTASLPFTRMHNQEQRTLDTWNGIFLEIFLNLKPMEIAKRPYDIICRSIKVMHFCQIIRGWLNIGARHAHLKFET